MKSIEKPIERIGTKLKEKDGRLTYYNVQLYFEV